MFAADQGVTPSAGYIEDVFSTYLYTGDGSTQTINNGIDLSGKGGLVWIKRRDAISDHRFTDTLRGTTKVLSSNSTSAEVTDTNGLTAFGSTGFTIGSDSGYNLNSSTYASWTFRKQPKFFDVVTYTGNGANRTISHNLGSVPGCIIVKRTDTTADWQVYHRSIANTEYLVLNTTADKATGATRWNSTTPTSTVFSLGTDTTVNASGGTYVAYLFAHDAGGFGASGSDNVITCGSFTTDGSGNATVTLGYEPQWVMMKSSSAGASFSWAMFDSMRGLPVSASGAGGNAILLANASNTETFNFTYIRPSATGFSTEPTSVPASTTYIYIAIRRGPMKTPTTGTSVYNPIARSGNSTATTVTGVGFAPDLIFEAPRTNSGGNNWVWFDRLRGGAQILSSDNTGAEVTNSAVIQSDSLSTTMDGFRIQTANPINASGNTYVYYPLRRAPGFFDVVCYTGNSTAGRTIQHNLGAVPELIIVKARNLAENWYVYSTPLGNTKSVQLNQTNAQNAGSVTYWNSTNPTSSVFTLGANAEVNGAYDYVAYLFATCPGVSKVGSYTGTGSTLQIDCGFTGGARFVLIKRTDSAGDWYVWDSARGIVAGNDPYLLLNSTAAEVTTTDWVDTHSPGFELSSAVGNNANINTATYIFLAIA